MSVLALHAASALNELAERISAETNALVRKLEDVPHQVRMLSASVTAQASVGYSTRSESVLELIRRDAMQLRAHAEVTTAVLRSARDTASLAACCTRAVTEVLAHEIAGTDLSASTAAMLLWALWEQDVPEYSKALFDLGARFASLNDLRSVLDTQSALAACCYGFEQPRILIPLLTQNSSVPVGELRAAASACAA